MQFEDMKSAWQILDRRLEQQHAMNLQLFRDSRANRARSGLRPLFWGQIVQMVLGASMILLGVSVWSSHRDFSGLFFGAIVVHVYGVACIGAAVITLSMIRSLDFSASVLAIQQQLARLRAFYICSGMIVGLSWWLFWIPFFATFFAWATGADFYASLGGAVVSACIGVGLSGLLGTWVFHRWAQRSGHRPLVKAMNDAMGGDSLRRAQSVLDEIRSFEQEDPPEPGMA